MRFLSYQHRISFTILPTNVSTSSAGSDQAPSPYSTPQQTRSLKPCLSGHTLPSASPMTHQLTISTPQTMLREHSPTAIRRSSTVQLTRSWPMQPLDLVLQGSRMIPRMETCTWPVQDLTRFR